MNFIPTKNTSGTSLMGEINISFEKLVKIFGQPHHNGDGYKVDAEWGIKFTDGLYKNVVATIYNWKDGKNYCGDEGLDVENITEWHIGGMTPQAFELVSETIKQFEKNNK